MSEGWTCYERLEAAYNLEEADRVPVAPLVIYLPPYLAGVSFRDMLEDPETAAQACIDRQDVIGDGLHPVMTLLNHQYIVPDANWDQVTLDWRIYDDFPPKGNVPSAYFDRVMIEDYDDVMRRGFATLLFNKKICGDVFANSVSQFLWNGFEYPKLFAKAFRRFVEETGKALLFGSRCMIPFDSLITYRTFPLIATDIYERPEKIHAFCDFMAKYDIYRAMSKAMDFGAGVVPGAEKIFLGNGMGAPPYITPRLFDEFEYPGLKRQVDIAVEHGFKLHVHLDGDHTACLETLRRLADDVPKGSLMLDFEKTDMARAKKVLGDRVCIYGNVPGVMLVYGTPKEVDEYCKRLIEDCAEGGGFVLGTECEAPWDSKPENIHAMLESVEKYGQYGNPKPRVSEAALLEAARARLKPPAVDETNLEMARFLFGDDADAMMENAPWSFLLAKVMWKRGEEPWAR